MPVIGGNALRIVAVGGVFSVLAAGAALAAEMPVKARVVAPAAAFNWTGFYAGVYAGGAWADDVTATDLVSQGGVFPAGTLYNLGTAYSYDMDSSFIGGLTVGWNWQAAGSPLVVGIEGEIGYLSLSGSAVAAGQFGGVTQLVSTTEVGDWYGIIATRFGFAVNRALVYGKVGAAVVDVSASSIDNSMAAPNGATVNATGSDTEVTWAAGVGLEWAWTDRWSVKGEYLFIDLPSSIRVCGPGGGTGAGSTFCGTHSLPSGVSTVKLGINYRFGR